MKEYYYIEKDGQIFLLEKGGKLVFPEKKDIPFDFTVLREMKVDAPGVKIFYCSPKIDRHPEDWPNKDTIPLEDNVDKVVRLTLNRSYVRHVSDAIIHKDGKILMVKASRGLTKGRWDLPGGFISYGESPEESLVREVKEETGLDVSVGDLIHFSTNVNHHYFIAFIYACQITGGTITPAPTEIGEVAWIPIDKAIKETTQKRFLCEALKKFKSST